MRIFRAAFLFSLTVFCSAGPLVTSAADEGKISVNSELDKAFLTIGDPVTYTVTVKHDPSVQALSRIPPPDTDILKIKKAEDIKEERDKQIVEGRRFTLTTFKLGQHILEPVEIEYRIGNGEPQKLSTNQIFLTVKSVAEGEQKMDIKGLKSVVALTGSALTIVLIILLLVLGLGGFLLYGYLRKKPELLRPSAPIVTPEEEAMSLLNQLFDSDMIRRGKIKEYYLRLSEILRAYFEKRFGILAIESTTDEIVRSLKKKEVNRALIDKINETLAAADLAKFAKWKPDPPRIIQLNQKSKQIVEEAAPKEVKEVPGGV